MSLSPESMQSLLMISGMGILCWVFLRNRWKRRGWGREQFTASSLAHNANASRTPDKFSGTKSLSAPVEVLKWQVELHELGRELKAELDTKMLAVRTLTRQYEQAAGRLNALIRLAEQVSQPRADQSASCAPAVRQLAASGWKDRQIAESLQLPLDSVRSILITSQLPNA